MSGKFLASLFGVKLSEQAPQLTSLVPQRVSEMIVKGQLPGFTPSNIMLGKNETCHFMDRAALVLKKRERYYKTHRRGNSFKITKNWTMHSSNGQARPVEQEWYEYKEGVVFVTNERILFVAQEHGFEKRIRNLSATIPYRDAIGLQFGSQTINLMMPKPQLMVMILQML